MAEYRDSLGGRIYQNNGQWMYEDPTADRGEYFDAEGRRIYKSGDQYSYTDDFTNRPASEAERAQGIFNQTGQRLHSTLASARKAFEQSGIQLAYPQITFERLMQMQGQTVADVDGEQWTTTPTQESGIRLGTQTGLGEALSMAGLAFGGMAGLSGLGLLGGAEAAALSGASPYSLGAAQFGTGASALPNALGAYPSLQAAAAGEIGAGLGGSLGGGLGGAANALGGGVADIWGMPDVYDPGYTPPGGGPAQLPGVSNLPGTNSPVLPTAPGGTGTIIDGVPPVGTAAGALGGSAAQGILSKIMSGTATADDWAKIAGQVGATGLGVLGSISQSNALKDLAQQNNTMRKPYLDASMGYLNNPQSYFGGPVAQEAMRGMGAVLSKNFGNVGESPTAQTMMLQGMAPSYWNTVSQLGNIGTGGQAAATAIGLEGVKSQGNIYNVLGAGLNDLTQPKPDYAKGVLDLFKNSLV